MIKIVSAKTFFQKMIGLMGKNDINYGLFFSNVKSVHTFFMKEPIDIIGLNENMIVQEIIPNVKKNKIILLKNSMHILELPNNYSKHYSIGQKVSL